MPRLRKSSCRDNRSDPDAAVSFRERWERLVRGAGAQRIRRRVQGAEREPADPYRTRRIIACRGRLNHRVELTSEVGKGRRDNAFGQRGPDAHARQESAGCADADKTTDQLRPVNCLRQQIVFSNVGVCVRGQGYCRGIIGSAKGPR